MLLSIDTSAGTSAAVFDHAKLMASSHFEDPFGHAENIAKAVSEVLSESQLSPADLTGIAVGTGPAPYTGLRVGIAAAKALAAPLGVRLHGVMVLDAIAHATSGARMLVTTDAKRGEFFVATYLEGKREFGPEVVHPDRLLEFQGYERVSKAADAEMVGSYAVWALEHGVDLSDTSAIYLRSPDVTPSSGKRVSG